VEIHRGDISGDVFATTQSFQGKDGLTEIDLLQVEATVPIRHKHHTLPFMHGYSAFRVEGTQYQWKKHRELFDQSSGKHMATFDISSDKESEKLGQLTVLPDGKDMTDLIVVTCLVDHERGDEGKYKVLVREQVGSNIGRPTRTLLLRVNRSKWWDSLLEIYVVFWFSSGLDVGKGPGEWEYDTADTLFSRLSWVGSEKKTTKGHKRISSFKDLLQE
jgi:hypothetical protein